MATLTIPGSRVSEVRALTGIRGVAALYVIVLHYFAPLPLRSHLLCFFGHGYLAVDLFFSLSGFVMALNYSGMFINGVRLSGYIRFLSRRMARIYPLYVVALLVATALSAYGYLPLYGASVKATFWSNLFLIQNWGRWASMDYPAWSISAEWFAYIVFPFVLQPIFHSRSWTWSATILCSAGLCALTAFSYFHAGWPDLLNRSSGPLSLVRCFAEFCLGMIAYRTTLTSSGQTVKRSSWMTYVVMLAIIVLLAFRGTDLLVALLFPWVVFSLNGSATRISRLLGSPPVEYLGLLSFSLYLIHPLLTGPLNRLDLAMQGRSLSHTHSIAVGLILPILFLCSMATYHSIEVPGRRVLRDLLDFERREHPPNLQLAGHGKVKEIRSRASFSEKGDA